MAESKQIAGLVGPILVVVTLSEIVNPRVWDTVSAPDTYQAGLLAFVAGFSIVRAHNRWTAGWPVVLGYNGGSLSSPLLFPHKDHWNDFRK